MNLQIGTSPFRYEWISDWGAIPDPESAKSGWAHHGMAVATSGEIIGIHPAKSTVLVFSETGDLQRSFPVPIREGHQLALSAQGGEQYLWIADPGSKNMNQGGIYEPVRGKWDGQVLRVSLEGEVQQTIGKPPHPAYVEGNFAPTSMAVFEISSGGNGDIWVADGYGESYLHRFDSTGAYVGSINGEEGAAGRFDCPHGVWVDYRKDDPELYIADRANRRVQVYDLEGGYIRTFGSDVLTSPSAFAVDGSHMIVAELRARLAVFDLGDNFVTYIGENERISRVERNSKDDVPGWPNNLDEDGNVARSRILESGKFNSPHGIATDSAGNIYSGEWLIGGRYTKLVRLAG